MSDKERKLEPCPFCGAPAREGVYSGSPSIACTKCPAGMGGEESTASAEELRSAWARRTGIATMQALELLKTAADGDEGEYVLGKSWHEAARAALDAPAPTVDQAITSLVSALAASKGWMRGYAEAVIRDAIDRKEPSSQELSDEQIQSIAYDCNALPEVVTDKTLLAFARAIIAAKAQGGSHG